MLGLDFINALHQKLYRENKEKQNSEERQRVKTHKTVSDAIDGILYNKTPRKPGPDLPERVMVEGIEKLEKARKQHFERQIREKKPKKKWGLFIILFLLAVIIAGTAIVGRELIVKLSGYINI